MQQLHNPPRNLTFSNITNSISRGRITEATLLRQMELTTYGDDTSAAGGDVLIDT